MRIAILEDNPDDAAQLIQMIERFFKENCPEDVPVTEVYSNASFFLEQYKGIYSILFLDIQMPGMNGMLAAQRIRAIDPDTPLIFVTNMAQYAIRGYDVNAIGFIVKPLRWKDFYLTMRRAVIQTQFQTGRTLLFSSRNGIRKVFTKDIYYIEVNRHSLSCHTKADIITGSGNLAEIQERAGSNFILCTRSILVNAYMIRNIHGLEIELENSEILPISRPRKKDFMEDFSRWLGGEIK